MGISDRPRAASSVLRLGRKVAEFARETVNAADLVAAITGIRSRSSGLL